MPQWTATGEDARFAGVHHTDAEREYAYDRQSKVGKLDKALDEASAKSWTVIDMKQERKTVFSTQKSALSPARRNPERQVEIPGAAAGWLGGLRFIRASLRRVEALDERE